MRCVLCKVQFLFVMWAVSEKNWASNKVGVVFDMYEQKLNFTDLCD
jgi:hypothetical protein